MTPSYGPMMPIVIPRGRTRASRNRLLRAALEDAPYTDQFVNTDKVGVAWMA